jgi:hypothetical protein
VLEAAGVETRRLRPTRCSQSFSNMPSAVMTSAMATEVMMKPLLI